jgi:hypothetical protein
LAQRVSAGAAGDASNDPGRKGYGWAEVWGCGIGQNWRLGKRGDRRAPQLGFLPLKPLDDGREVGAQIFAGEVFLFKKNKGRAGDQTNANSVKL